MGLSANYARVIVPQLSLPANNSTPKETKTKEETKGDETNSKPSENDILKNETLVEIHNYLEVYHEITNRLGNFYSETLAKMTGTLSLNKGVFNQIYNGILNDVVKNALEDAKSGNKLDFDELAQKVMVDVTAELEACNYNPAQYLKNQMDKDINKNH